LGFCSLQHNGNIEAHADIECRFVGGPVCSVGDNSRRIEERHGRINVTPDAALLLLLLLLRLWSNLSVTRRLHEEK